MQYKPVELNTPAFGIRLDPSKPAVASCIKVSARLLGRTSGVNETPCGQSPGGRNPANTGPGYRYPIMVILRTVFSFSMPSMAPT